MNYSRPYIMHVIDTLSLGGAERMAVEIANASDPNKYKVIICITRPNLDLKCQIGPHVQLICLGKRRSDFRGILKFIRLLKDKDRVLLHVHGRESFFFVVLAECIGRFRPPLIMHDHCGQIEIDQTMPLWFRLSGRFFIDRYVGVSDSFIRWAQKAGIPEQKIYIINNAIDFRRFNIQKSSYNSYNHGRKRLIGLAIANVRPQKDFENLISAVHKARSQDSFIIRIVGNIDDKRYYDKCMKLISKYALADKIEFAGPSKDIVKELYSADFGVLSSSSESGPLSLIEYLAAGLPVASTNVGFISRMLSGYGIVNFVPPQDPASLSKAIDDIVNLEPNERDEKSRIGRELANKLFDIKNVMPKWNDIYNQLLNTS